jgi:hypothetical protein
VDQLLADLPALDAPLLAEIQTGVMARSLAIALVVVAPFWFVLRRRMRRADGPAEQPAAPTPAAAPSLEDLVERIAELAATADDGDGSVTVRVPRGLTIDGDPAPEPVVDAIVRDAIARSGLVPTAELDTTHGRLIECRPRAGASAG